MTKFRDPYFNGFRRWLAVAAAATALLAFGPTLTDAQDYASPAPYHFDFDGKPVRHRHVVKRAAPVKTVTTQKAVEPVPAAPVAQAPAPVVAPVPATVVEPLPAPAVPVVAAPVAPVTAKDVEVIRHLDEPPAMPGDMSSIDTSSAGAFLFSVPVVAGNAVSSGVEVVHKRTGGGIKFLVVMLVITVAALGALRLAAVKLKGVYSTTWNFVWAWVKWGLQLLWWVVKLALSYAWAQIKVLYGKVLLRFETWRAARAAPPPPPKAPTASA